MAKNNNVKDFAKDIADAIRAKTGTTAKINPQNFSTVILSIESGANDKPDVGKAMLVTYAKNNFETPLKNVLTTIKSGSTSLASGYTDSQGRFAQQVDSGTYTITTGAKDYHKVPESRQVTADADKATYVYMDYDATSLTVTAKKDDGTLIPNVALTAVMNYGGNVYNIGGSTKENGVGVIIVPPATGTLKVKTNIDGYYTPASPSVTTTLGQNTDVELIYNRIVTALDLNVVDYKGSPVTGATVVMTGPATYSGETDDSGKFYKEVLAGTYTISVTAPAGLLSPEDSVVSIQQDTVQSANIVCQKDMSAIDPVFGNNSVETIVSVANEISLANMTSAQVAETYGWNIGDTVTIPLTTGENIEMRIIGFNHDDLSDDNYKAGITLEMVGCLSTTASIFNQTYNKYGWGAATLLSKLIDYKETLPQVLQDAIQTVDKKYAYGGGSSNLGVGVARNDLFVLADVELRGSAATSQSALEEGVQYEYWASNYLAESSLIKFKDGTASGWWIRSLPASSDRYFYQISGSGKLSTIDSYKSSGVSFAFCIGNGALTNYVPPESYKAFNEYTVSELKDAFAYMNANNMSGGDIKREYGWAVGDTTTMTLSTGESIDVRIIGIGHDVKSDGSGKAPLTLEMVKILPTGTKMMSVDSNEGGYVSSIVRNTYMPNLKQKLPKEWQDMIVAVDKKSANGGAENYTETITSSEELFIISVIELTGYPTTLGGAQEGRSYEYWSNTSATRKKDPVTWLPGGAAPSYWWLRSCGNSNNTFYIVNNNGSIIEESVSTYARGISFAFCV